MFIRLLALCVLFCSIASSASAIEVYINGKRVDGAIREEVIQKVNLQFDGQGNLFINAPDYTVKADVVVGDKAAESVGPKGYWLSIENLIPGQYMVLVKVNGKKVARMMATKRQKVVEITDKLKAGGNAVEVVYYPVPNAEKDLAGEAVRVTIGAGTMSEDGSLTFRRVLGSHARKAGSSSAEAAMIPLKLQ